MRNILKAILVSASVLFSASAVSALDQLPITWNHNGSFMLSSQDGKDVTINYSRPKSGMRSVGVNNGTTLFYGTRNRNNVITGTAYVFSNRCGGTPYQVSGSVFPYGSNYRIELFGPAPILDGSCNIVGYANNSNSRLVFDGFFHD